MPIKKKTPERTVVMFARVQSEEKLSVSDPELPKRISDFRIEYPTRQVYCVDMAIINRTAPTYQIDKKNEYPDY